MDKKINILFKDLCCSRCKSDFTEESVEIIRREPSMLVIRLVCPTCYKSFGVAFLGISDLDVKPEDETKRVLKVQEGLPPISEDDVLDAHKFIKNLDEHWQKYLPN